MRTTLLAMSILIAGTAAATARPTPYALDASASIIAFETDFGGGIAKIKGKMPVTKANLVIDFDKVSASTVDVAVDAGRATTSNPLATDAMLGEKVLDVARHPDIAFVSTAVRRDGDGAKIDGNLTIRGVTRPVTLEAMIYRQKGTDAGDLSRLAILLSGKISRSAFGASGFPDMVGDEVRLKILAHIEQGR